jgi:hypothetical protein
MNGKVSRKLREMSKGDKKLHKILKKAWIMTPWNEKKIKENIQNVQKNLIRAGSQI